MTIEEANNRTNSSLENILIRVCYNNNNSSSPSFLFHLGANMDYHSPIQVQDIQKKVHAVPPGMLFLLSQWSNPIMHLIDDSAARPSTSTSTTEYYVYNLGLRNSIGGQIDGPIFCSGPSIHATIAATYYWYM